MNGTAQFQQCRSGCKGRVLGFSSARKPKGPKNRSLTSFDAPGPVLPGYFVDVHIAWLVLLTRRLRNLVSQLCTEKDQLPIGLRLIGPSDLTCILVSVGNSSEIHSANRESQASIAKAGGGHSLHRTGVFDPFPISSGKGAGLAQRLLRVLETEARKFIIFDEIIIVVCMISGVPVSS